MRIAALILGIVLSIVAGLQSIALFAVSSVGDSLDEKSDPSNTTGAGALGAFAAFMMFVAAAFVIAKPKVARALFGVAALFSCSLALPVSPMPGFGLSCPLPSPCCRISASVRLPRSVSVSARSFAPISSLPSRSRSKRSSRRVGLRGDP